MHLTAFARQEGSLCDPSMGETWRALKTGYITLPFTGKSIILIVLCLQKDRWKKCVYFDDEIWDEQWWEENTAILRYLSARSGKKVYMVWCV